MKETAEVVSPLIPAYFETLKEKDKKLFDLTEPLLAKRIKIAQLRPAITRLSYEVCGGKNWKQIAEICAVMEIHNMYLYFHNWIFDNKNHVWQDKLASARNSINNTIIAASLTRELIAQVIDKIHLSLEKKLLISTGGSNPPVSARCPTLNWIMTVDIGHWDFLIH
ncbi:hypothetical protein HY384_02745 [Candidatus Daviesbacteria bacterium]|nr:hypothetical protein [Candidatus Daviesbacteria bacterium]MBI4038854.1 hypothetical protein [Candidatus Daviesbacteria bacterium]